MKASVQQSHKKVGKENQELTKINEASEMKATVNGQNKLAAVYQEISKFKEDIAMKLSMIITKNTPAKILGGLALGALLLTATALPLGTAYADGPSRPLITEEATIDRGVDNLPVDAWMYDSPFYQDFSEASRVEVGIALLEAQDTPLDASMYDSPFFQDFSAAGRVEAGTGLLEAQDTPLDAWMYDSPFFQDFSAAGRVEVGTGLLEAQDTPLDAWMYDSPFFQDFSAAGRVEVGTGLLAAQDTTLDAWMYDSPFYQDFSQVGLGR